MNTSGVIGLPLRLVVAIAIGGTALALVVGYIETTKLPPSLLVSWDKNTYEIGDDGKITIEVTVKDEKNNLIDNAQVVIYGLGDVGSGKTVNGKTTISLSPHFRENEGYLNIEVKAAGYKPYKGEEEIRVVKG